MNFSRGGKKGVGKMCSECNGHGKMMINRSLGMGMIQQSWAECDRCSGQGTVFDKKDRCCKCNGAKTIKQTKVLEVAVAPGMRENEKIVFREEGDYEVRY